MKRVVGICLMILVGMSDQLCLAQTNVEQSITMGAPFGDHAVLQQKIQLPVWGTAWPTANVTVAFDGQSKSAITDAKGQWRVLLDPMTAVKLSSVNQVPEGKKMTVTCEKDGRKIVKELKAAGKPIDLQAINHEVVNKFRRKR